MYFFAWINFHILFIDVRMTRKKILGGGQKEHRSSPKTDREREEPQHVAPPLRCWSIADQCVRGNFREESSCLARWHDRDRNRQLRLFALIRAHGRASERYIATVAKPRVETKRKPAEGG